MNTQPEFENEKKYQILGYFAYHTYLVILDCDEAQEEFRVYFGNGTENLPNSTTNPYILKTDILGKAKALFEDRIYHVIERTAVIDISIFMRHSSEIDLRKSYS